jgi:hypothetical protein
VIKQGGDEKVGVYYEHILKLANYIQHQVNNSLLNMFTTISLNSYIGDEEGHLV